MEVFLNLISSTDFLLGVGASLIGSAFWSLFQAPFFTTRGIQRRYEKRLEDSLSSTTQAIKKLESNGGVVAAANAIIDSFDIHASRYHTLKPIVINEQIEELRSLIEKHNDPNSSEVSISEITQKLRLLKSSWDNSRMSMNGALEGIKQQLGL